MKPINDKERTLAYFQFLALSILFIVVWTVAVFFDYRVKAKDYQQIKEENKKLKETVLTTSSLSVSIDSVSKLVSTFEQLTPSQYEDIRLKFFDGLNNTFPSNMSDSTELSKINFGLVKVFTNWYYAVGSKINVNPKNQLIEKLNADIKDLQNKLDDKGRDFDHYRESHPG